MNASNNHVLRAASPASRFGARASFLFHSSLFALLISLSPVPAANILMVVGNANGTVTPDTLGPGDLFVRNYLRDSLGHAVTVRHDTASGSSLLTAALASNLVLIVESVTSTSLTNKLKATPTPVLSYEAFIQDDMGFTAQGAGCDPGPPSATCLFGSVENHDRVRILTPSHPLAAGFADTVTVYSVTNRELTWGKVATSATVVATLVNDTSGAVIYTYAKDAVLFDGTVAAGLRIGFYLEDDNTFGTPNFMTADGRRLFDAAVAYGLGGSVSVFPGADASPRRPHRVSPGWLPEFRGRDALGRKAVLPAFFPAFDAAR
jgi:hypothetical protein